MSEYLTAALQTLTPYVPGEQPQGGVLIKLNTNESPFPPPAAVQRAVAEEAGRMQLYSDPDCRALRATAADAFGLRPDEVLPVNGSDEGLSFAFSAFCDAGRPALFADVTYGFYPIFAAYARVPYCIIPLREDWTLRVDDYIGYRGTVFIANPNAPTGMVISPAELERLAAADRGRVVVVDEAYAGFGAESCVPLLRRNKNLLVMRTFSKAMSLAGARLGFCLGDAALIADLNRLRCTVNPYNVNRMTQAAGIAAFASDAEYRANCAQIVAVRDACAERLRALGFTVLPSATNFLFAGNGPISGAALAAGLRQRGILVRHFTDTRTADFCRISIGTAEAMQTLTDTVGTMIKEGN